MVTNKEGKKRIRAVFFQRRGTCMDKRQEDEGARSSIVRPARQKRDQEAKEAGT